MQALIDLGPTWVAVESPTRPLDKFDPPYDGQYPGSRLRDELIVYSPGYERSSTGTNEWGQEAIVEDGVVTSLNLNDSPIPENGFVVSGHLIGAWWILRHLEPGVRVETDGVMIRVISPPAEEMAPEDLLMLVRIRALNHLMNHGDVRVARHILRDTILANRSGEPLDMERLVNYSRVLDSLEVGR